MSAESDMVEVKNTSSSRPSCSSSIACTSRPTCPSTDTRSIGDTVIWPLYVARTLAAWGDRTWQFVGAEMNERLVQKWKPWIMNKEKSYFLNSKYRYLLFEYHRTVDTFCWAVRQVRSLSEALDKLEACRFLTGIPILAVFSLFKVVFK